MTRLLLVLLDLRSLVSLSLLEPQLQVVSLDEDLCNGMFSEDSLEAAVLFWLVWLGSLCVEPSESSERRRARRKVLRIAIV